MDFSLLILALEQLGIIWLIFSAEVMTESCDVVVFASVLLSFLTGAFGDFYWESAALKWDVFVEFVWICGFMCRGI